MSKVAHKTVQETVAAARQFVMDEEARVAFTASTGVERVIANHETHGMRKLLNYIEWYLGVDTMGEPSDWAGGV